MTRFPGFSASNFDHPECVQPSVFWTGEAGVLIMETVLKIRRMQQVDGKSINTIANITSLSRNTVLKNLRQPPSGISWGGPFSIAKRSCEAGFRPPPLCVLSAAHNADLKGMVVISSPRSQLAPFKPHRFGQRP